MALPSYGDPAASEAEARKIMEKLGYGPGNGSRSRWRPATSNFRDPAVILVDQLNKIHFDAELDIIESLGLVQPPHQAGLFGRPQSRRGRHRRSRRRPNGGIRLQVGRATSRILQPPDRQAPGPAVAGTRSGQAKRDRLEDRADTGRGRRTADHLSRHRATCWHPHFKGHVQHENSIYNNWRFEHVWLDK